MMLAQPPRSSRRPIGRHRAHFLSAPGRMPVAFGSRRLRATAGAAGTAAGSARRQPLNAEAKRLPIVRSASAMERPSVVSPTSRATLAFWVFIRAGACLKLW